MVVNCLGNDIPMPLLKSSLSRESLTTLVVTMDLIICFVFIIYIKVEQVNIKRESQINDSDFVTMSDFTVRIKNMPPKKSYESL